LGDGNICYKNKPMIHRILSIFDPNDYNRNKKKECQSILDYPPFHFNTGECPDKKDDEDEDTAKRRIQITDLNKLVPGMPLWCYYGASDDWRYHKAMFLTTEQNLEEGLIGVYYTAKRKKKWIPCDWCETGFDMLRDNEVLWSCFFDDDDVFSSNNCNYLVDYNNPIFHRSFKLLWEMNNKKIKEKNNVIFTYTAFDSIEKEKKDKGENLYMNIVSTPIPLWINASSYTTIYSHLPFLAEEVNQIDDKLKLYQLYKDDPYASQVLPRSYGSFKDALLDTIPEAENGENIIFYIKSSGGTRGEDIHIKTRSELLEEYGEYVQWEGDDIIQRAVTDLYTIEGNGPLSGRRFDIRFFVIIAHGKAFLHSNMWCKWVLDGPKYDPNDTNPNHQISNLGVYGDGDTARLIFPDIIDTNEWRNKNEKKKENSSNNKFRRAEPHEWRDALSESLDASNAIFTALKNVTTHDPTKYVLLGGNAIVKKDGSVVIIEFNAWPDLTSKHYRLMECIEEGRCRRMVILLENNDDDGSVVNNDNYHVTEQTPVTDIISREVLATVLRDMASLVMNIQPSYEIKGLREISRNEDETNEE